MVSLTLVSSNKEEDVARISAEREWKENILHKLIWSVISREYLDEKEGKLVWGSYYIVSCHATLKNRKEDVEGYVYINISVTKHDLDRLNSPVSCMLNQLVEAQNKVKETWIQTYLLGEITYE